MVLTRSSRRRVAMAPGGCPRSPAFYISFCLLSEVVHSALGCLATTGVGAPCMHVHLILPMGGGRGAFKAPCTSAIGGLPLPYCF